MSFRAGWNRIFWKYDIISSVQFSPSVVSDSLQPHESQHAGPPCPSPTHGVHSNSHPSSQWCHPAISSSVIPFFSCPQSLPASKSFPVSQLFAWGGQSTGVSALASVLPKNTQGWSPLEWTGWISLDSQESSPTPQFKSINSSALSFLHSPALTSIQSHHFMANRRGKRGSSGRFYFLGSKITADGDCSHEIKRCLLLGRKVMTNLDSIFKSRLRLVKAMVFPVVMYGCESWTVKKAERRRIDAFELWCWRRLLRVRWTARRSNQSILKEISPGISLEGMMLKLKLQYFGHLMWRVDSLGKTLMLGSTGGRRRRG